MRSLSLLVFALRGLSSLVAFANGENLDVLRCTGRGERILTIEQAAVPDAYSAVILENGEIKGMPQSVVRELPDATTLVGFSGPGLILNIPNLQLADIPITQARGTLQIAGDAEPMEVLCNKGPAFICKPGETKPNPLSPAPCLCKPVIGWHCPK